MRSPRPLRAARAPSPSAMFSATVSPSNSEKCWNTMPMPFCARLGRAGRGIGLAVQVHGARVRPQDAVDDLDQGGLAGAVLARAGRGSRPFPRRATRRRWRARPGTAWRCPAAPAEGRSWRRPAHAARTWGQVARRRPKLWCPLSRYSTRHAPAPILRGECTSVTGQPQRPVASRRNSLGSQRRWRCTLPALPIGDECQGAAHCPQNRQRTRHRDFAAPLQP